jgi:hypothetical protein
MASEANAIEVILMTGHGGHKVVQDATRIPAFECMAKPLSLSHLLNTIRRAHAATVVRRVNHRESIEDLVHSLKRAKTLSERPASAERGCYKGPPCPGELPDGCPDWQRDPLGFALAREAALNGAEAAMPAVDVRADGQWYGELLDRAADQARALLPTIEPLTELLLGRRPITRTPVTLRSVLDGLARRHMATLLPITTLPRDPVLLIDEEILSLVLDQLIDDVVRSGPDALPIRIDTEVGPNSVVIRAASASADAAADHASLPTADLVQRFLSTAPKGCGGTATESSQWPADLQNSSQGATNFGDRTLVSPNRVVAETGGLGLRIAAAASRLLDSHLERTGAFPASSTTTLVIATRPNPGPFGA